ncbi:uncharacterized protein F4822DRAFT_37429 [Hypoxylon trugodes]|uniref:uncharacterized protein n=1 Tax=Hypoxylon trugodes TaxID=326681 RepID=UPI002196F448|nr:uncharacterized protein F4822DRAFT_37429 [Hypoxylon trugodes]KAI1394129.1 hypothetical protein F4822DRAFT_37429 [Hypoxylon trugodes]
MNNFGVIELASTKTTNAPGWAYVPDTGPHPSTQIQPGNRKRAARNANQASTSALYADADARQEAKLRREIEALDRDNYHRDASGIPIPAAVRSGNKAVRKHTPNVRRILQSQKTFANHLDDFEALGAQGGATTTTGGGGAAAGASAAAGGSSRRGTIVEKQTQQKGNKKAAKSTSRSASISKATPVKQEDDIEMLDAPPSDQDQEDNPSTLLTPYSRPGYPPEHPLDGDPLLESRVPPLPTDAELKALLAAPPLNYTEARGRWTLEDEGMGSKRYPARVFCEVCGYWGRVRCMKCGIRVCALDCLETHREECVTRYGL